MFLNEELGSDKKFNEESVEESDEKFDDKSDDESDEKFDDKLNDEFEQNNQVRVDLTAT